jgi:hypothetical protein
MPKDFELEVDPETAVELEKLGAEPVTTGETTRPAVEPEDKAADGTGEPETPIAPKATRPIVQPKTNGKPSKVDLTAIPEFREWQAGKDKEVAQAKREAEEARAEKQQFLLQQQALQQTAIEQQLDQTVDPAERSRLNHQLVQIGYAQERAWGQYFDKQLKDRGLDPAGWDFMKYRSMGQPGAVLFERDLTAAENAKLRRELDETKKASSPATIADMVKRELAQALHAQGMNAVEVAAPVGAAGSDDWNEDKDKLQRGEMSPAAFKKKYRGS